MQVEKVLKDENIWNKTKELLPLFTKYDIRCREVDEYILKYKPLYQNLLQDKLSNSIEYQQATERDKEIIEDAKHNWHDQNHEAFPLIPCDDQEYVPLPKAILKPKL